MAKMITPFSGIVLCVASTEGIIDQSTIAKVANKCLELKDVAASFVIGQSGADEIRVSARSIGEINVQTIMESLGGGGHFSSSAGSFHNMTLAKVEGVVKDAIQQYLDEEKIRENKLKARGAEKEKK
jgi:c-di-AMP phosphodiesterase-like protein